MPYLGAPLHIQVADLLSSATRTTIDWLVDTMVDAEHGGDSEANVNYARAASLTALRRDLATGYRDTDLSADNAAWLYEYAGIVLRHEVNNRLTARLCQCKAIFPQGCPHGTPVDSRWCGEHVDANASEIYGARVCHTCYAHLVVTRWA